MLQNQSWQKIRRIWESLQLWQWHLPRVRTRLLRTSRRKLCLQAESTTPHRRSQNIGREWTGHHRRFCSVSSRESNHRKLVTGRFLWTKQCPLKQFQFPWNTTDNFHVISSYLDYLNEIVGNQRQNVAYQHQNDSTEIFYLRHHIITFCQLTGRLKVDNETKMLRVDAYSFCKSESCDTRFFR